MDAARTSAPLLGEPPAVELMNTIWADRDGLRDVLANPADAAAWLRAIGDRLLPRPATTGTPEPSGVTVAATGTPEAPGRAEAAAAPEAASGAGGVTPRLVRELRQLRDALRRLAATSTGDDRPAAASAITGLDAAVAAVNRASARAPTWSRLVWPDTGEPHRDPDSAHGWPEVALSLLAEQGIALFTGADRPALRACRAPGCVRYFVRQHPRREWCTDACGNRARVARHYQRHRAGPNH